MLPEPLIERIETRPTSHWLALALCAALVGCSGGNPRMGSADLTVPARPADIIGAVKRVELGRDGASASSGVSASAPVSCPPDCEPGTSLPTVLVEQQTTSQGAPPLAAVITITPQTRLLRRVNGRLVAASVHSIRIGERGSAWFDGPVAESFPVRASASALVMEGQ